MTQKDFDKLDPASSVDLLTILQARFRDRVPRNTITLEDVMRMQGEQRVLDYIIGILQNEEVKKGIA